MATKKEILEEALALALDVGWKRVQTHPVTSTYFFCAQGYPRLSPGDMARELPSNYRDALLRLSNRSWCSARMWNLLSRLKLVSFDSAERINGRGDFTEYGRSVLIWLGACLHESREGPTYHTKRGIILYSESCVKCGAKRLERDSWKSAEDFARYNSHLKIYNHE